MAERIVMKKEKSKKKPIIIILIVFVVLFILYWALSFTVVYMLESNLFSRVEIPTNPNSIVFHGDYEKMKDEKFTRREIEFESDEYLLRGYDYGYDLEDKEGLFVLSHGFQSNQNAYLYMAKYLVEKGYEVITYDNTGTVRSDGKDMIALSHSPIDLYHCLNYIDDSSEYEGLDLYLLGHSWGGYAVTNVFNFEDIPEIKGVIAFSSFDYSPTMLTQFGVSANVAPEFVINVLSPTITIYEYLKVGNQAFTHSYDGINAHPETKFMIAHGMEDDLIPIDRCSVYSMRPKITNPSATFIPLEGKDHGHVFMTINASEYEEEVMKEYQELIDTYSGQELTEKIEELRESISLDKINELDTPMLDNLLSQVTSA